MNPDEEKILEQLYNRLHDVLLLDKNISSIKSIIFSLLKIKNNRRFTILTKAAIDKNRFTPIEIETLKSLKYIREIEGTSKISLSAKGIYYIEEKRSIYANYSIIDFIDEEFFLVVNESIKELKEREKVILLAMILGRSFSKNSVVDFRRSEKTKDEWTEITNISMELLKKFGVIDFESPIDIYGESKSDEAIINLYRHSEELPRKTNNIFQSNLNKLQYYLDLDNQGEFDSERLHKLFKKLFYKISLNNEQINDILNICTEISRTKDIFLYDPDKHIFSDIKYDRKIKETLLSI